MSYVTARITFTLLTYLYVELAQCLVFFSGRKVYNPPGKRLGTY